MSVYTRSWMGGPPAESATVFAVMASKATQTLLTARPDSDFDWQWTKVDAEALDWEESMDVDEADEAGEAPTGTSLPELSDEAVWGPFPSGYWEAVATAYGRWRKSPMYKYDVAAYNVEQVFGNMENFADSWVRPRFNNWLRDRRLHQHLKPWQQSGCSEMQLGHKRIDFIKYRYMPSAESASFRKPCTVFDSAE